MTSEFEDSPNISNARAKNAVSSSSSSCDSITRDHCHANTGCNKKMKKDSSHLLLHLQNNLPSNYTYHLTEHEDKERVCFTGALKEAFKACLTISNITSAEQVKTWVSEVASTSNI